MAKVKSLEKRPPDPDAVPYRAPKSGWAVGIRVFGLLGFFGGIVLAGQEENYYYGLGGLAYLLSNYFLANLVDKFKQMHYFLRGIYERGGRDDLPRASNR